MPTAEPPALDINLSGKEKAAIFLLTLGEETAAQILQNLNPREIQTIAATATRLPAIGEKLISGVRREFMDKLASSVSLSTRELRDKVRNILEQFVDPNEIDGYMEDVVITDDLAQTFESVRYVDGSTLAAFMADEHPQTVALILAHLEVGKAAQVLPLLPKERQADIVNRIANLEGVSPQLIRNVQEVFMHEIMASGAGKSRSVGGIEAVAGLMNNLDSQSVTEIFGRLEESDPKLCENIRQLMFVFTDLAKLDDRSFQQIIKEVTNEVLTLALKTAPDELREKIYRNISSRAAEMIAEELEVMGPVKLTDVENAQKEIVAIARRLEEEGKIALGGGGGEKLV